VTDLGSSFTTHGGQASVFMHEILIPELSHTQKLNAFQQAAT